MKNLKDLITEKLIITKDTKLSKHKISEISNNDWCNIENLRYNKNGRRTPELKYIEQIKQYKDSKKDIRKLISSTRSNTKLINEWLAAVDIEWDDAIKEFGKEIEKRTDITLDILHQYIYKLFIILKDNTKIDKLKCYMHYLDLYNIEYKL